MRKYLSSVPVLMAAAFLVGCTHTASLKKFSSGSGDNYTAFKNKNVAIVIDEAQIQDNHTTHSGGAGFKFEGVTTGITSALQSKVAPLAKKVDVVKSTEIKAQSYDYVLYPTVTARSVNDYFTMGCLIHFELVLKDGKGQILSSKGADGKTNFAFPNQFERKCNEAMADVFVRVSHPVLSLEKPTIKK